MFTSEQLDALQAAAESASPGPWEAGAQWVFTSPIYPDDRRLSDVLGMTFADTDRSAAEQARGQANAEFIAAWNPAVALDFIAEYREVVKQRDDVAKRLSEYLDDSTGGQLSKPWYPVSVMVEDTKAHYAEIAESDHADSCENKEALDTALSRIARVEALHPRIVGECHTCSDENGPMPWPCPTVGALTEGEPSE
jgi:hypothetical protein